MSEYLCSVVIPSYNRRTTLELLLAGLERQTIPQPQFEVVVVLDGSTDSSEEMLTQWKQSKRLLNLNWHKQTNSGQATARNRGVELAQAPIVVFLDDDVVPEPDLLAIHLEWHAQGQPLAVLGDYHMPDQDGKSLYHLSNWVWWEKLFMRRALPQHRPGYRDFCTGNVSLRKTDFLRVGGLDSGFRGYGGEDYELGYRLLEAGVRLVSDGRANARHLHHGSVAGRIRATSQEAHGDRLLGLKHPELRNGLRLHWLPGGRIGKAARLGLYAPFLGDFLLEPGLWLMAFLEKIKLRRRWLVVFNYLQAYAYWRGVRQAFGSVNEWKYYQADTPDEVEQTLDLTDGLPQNLADIWINGPSRLTLTYQGEELGTVRLYDYIDEALPKYLADNIANQLYSKLWLLLDQEKLNKVSSDYRAL